MISASPGTLSFLFTDIEGSTRLWEEFPDGMKDALRRHDAILRSAIEEAGGQVVKTMGDGMMAVFDRAPKAVAASLTAQRHLARERWAETGPLRARMGLHAGQADERAGDYFGPAVNRTARIMAAGHGGQVLLSSSAVALARESLPAGAGLIDLGEHRLKDLGRPEHVFQLAHPDLATTFPPLSTLRAQIRLPARTTQLVGRQDELQAIKSRILDTNVRLLTLTGPGGTGKTTLAIRAAEELSSVFPDGVAFVDLSGARDTDAVVLAIARAIGLDEAIDQSVADALKDRLSDRRMLLVLDNFEQVTKSASAVANLLRECSQVVILATSREPLHVRAEQVFPIPPLALPPAEARVTAAELARFEAVQLFTDRARVVRPDFELTDGNAAAVAEICRRLDGLPLAIELAAARLHLFTPDVLRDRLDDRLSVLRSGPRDLPERQQTLRATMDWSYELLDPGQQRLFEFLSVFAAAEISAVEAIATEANASDEGVGDVLDGLVDLVEKSLLRRIDTPGGEPRVTMLETIRAFAADRLAERADFRARVRRAHASHYAELAYRLRAELTGAQREGAMDAITDDLANLRIAWAYWIDDGNLQQLDKLADSLLILYDARGWYHETVELSSGLLAVLERAGSSPERVDQEIALRTTLARALMATKGFTTDVENAFAKAVELFEAGSSKRQQYLVLRGLASLYQFRSQFERAADLGREILALGEREGNPRMLIDGHLIIGAREMFIDNLQGGLEHLDAAIALFPRVEPRARVMRIGSDSRVACLTTSGFTLWVLGFPDKAVDRMNAALEIAVDLQHPFTSAYARFHAGLLRLWRREPDLALELADALLEIADEHDFRIWTAAGGSLKGAARVGLGEFDEGLAAIAEGMDRYAGLRSPPVFWPMLLFVRARACQEAGRPAEGLPHVESGIEMMGQGPGTTILAEFWLTKGDMLLDVSPKNGGGPAAAGQLFQQALERAVAQGARITQLRAALRLARLPQDDEARAAATRRLAEVYVTFDEGLTIPDLVEARELLEGFESNRSSAS